MDFDLAREPDARTEVKNSFPLDSGEEERIITLSLMNMVELDANPHSILKIGTYMNHEIPALFKAS